LSFDSTHHTSHRVRYFDVVVSVLDRQLQRERQEWDRRSSAPMTHEAAVGAMTEAMALFQQAASRQARIQSTATRFQSATPRSSEFVTFGLALRRLLIDQLCDVANAQRGIQDARTGLRSAQAMTAAQIQQEMVVLIRDAGEDLAAVNALLGFAPTDVQPR
jgi:hypothetical protein